MPLSEKARIEVYLPDLPRQAYQDLLDELEREFSYTFGGCTLLRGLEGNYLSRRGLRPADEMRRREKKSGAPFRERRSTKRTYGSRPSLR